MKSQRNTPLFEIKADARISTSIRLYEDGGMFDIEQDGEIIEFSPAQFHEFIQRVKAPTIENEAMRQMFLNPTEIKP